MHLHFLVLLSAGLVYAGSPSYDKAVKPFVAKNCAACHNPKLKSGGLDLTAATVPPETWEQARQRIAAGSMPPPGLPRPKSAAIAKLNQWIDAALEAEARRKPDPGRVTARRLNKFEYNQTIEDLLAIRIRPADDFPADDSGYGFDNIGDVLSVSSVLMEKYMAAAGKVSRLAVGSATIAAPTAQRIRNAQAPRDLQARRTFDIDGEYEITGGIAGRRNDNAPKATLALYLDGRELQRFEIDPRPNLSRTFSARVQIPNGCHEVRALILDDVYDLTVQANRDRNLIVDYVEIQGPYAPPAPSLTESQRLVFVCGHLPGQHLPECPRAILRNLARRAWRRPVTDAEVAGLLRFVDLARAEGDPVEEGIRVALQAMLVSPNFLFRIEHDPDLNSPRAVHPLNDYELASRLSYFIWSSLPDDDLFAAAQSGKLHDPAVVRAQVRRMLKDPKSSRLVENFAGQWLELRNLESVKPDPKRFPEFDDALRAAMRLETTLFFDTIVHEDRSLLDFIDARYTFLNERLAKHYQIDGVTGPEFRRVDLSGDQRGGVLTQASVLTVTSYPTRTSPVQRGKWLLENILGTPPPAPPPDVPPLDATKVDAGSTLRVQMEQHRANPACAGCHTKMDPLGFAFENYDAIGRFRSSEGSTPIDASGITPDGKAFRGAPELKLALRNQTPEFARCLTEKMLTYALGRGLERYDRPAVQSICRKMAETGYRFSDLVTQIVASTPFQMRRGEEGKR